MYQLINTRTSTLINRMHQRAQQDLEDAYAHEPVLLGVKTYQLEHCENELLIAMNRLLAKYADAQEAAIAARPMPALEDLLNETLIQH